MNIITQLYKNVGLLDLIFPYYQKLPSVFHKVVAEKFTEKAHQEIESRAFPNHLVFL